MALTTKRGRVVAGMNADVFVKSYWNYYLELEDQFVATKKFVEFDISNYATYIQ